LQNIYDNIPALLKQRPNWVSWGIRGAPLKAPFNPASLLSGRPFPAKAGVRETWGSYQAAAECVERGLARGIGYEFDNSGVYGVDLDHVIDEAGTLTSEAQEIVDRLNSFTELSPSGAGLHIFVLAPDAEITRHRRKDSFLEIYCEGRYFTVTGNVYGGVMVIETRTAELQAIHDNYLLSEPALKIVHPSPTQHVAPSDSETERFLHVGLRRDKVFAALWAGQRSHGNESSDDIALMNKLAYWISDPDAMIRAFMQSPYFMQKDEAHIRKCQRSDICRIRPKMPLLRYTPRR